ncbi:MAG TPA: hypothetical protein DDZ68_13235 [Parvularcula sp.]|nr:hypothetical protein [Parvularcula sp.]HBS31729.1 hypothetical protein [Parvularcula sp.]HBS36345.1 hypothetical protein [Parvularcula sp.]
MSAASISSILTIPDLAGYAGVGLVVVTYFLSQIGRMDVKRPIYPAINAVGAVMILFSLYHRPNPPSVVIEFFWLAISVIGFLRAVRPKA